MRLLLDIDTRAPLGIVEEAVKEYFPDEDMEIFLLDGSPEVQSCDGMKKSDVTPDLFKFVQEAFVRAMKEYQRTDSQELPPVSDILLTARHLALYAEGLSFLECRSKSVYQYLKRMASPSSRAGRMVISDFCTILGVNAAVANPSTDDLLGAIAAHARMNGTSGLRKLVRVARACEAIIQRRE